VNPLVEQYVRHAKRFGDPHTVFETAYADRLDWGSRAEWTGDWLAEQFSPTDLGYLASRLRRLELKGEAAYYWTGEGANRKRVRWPRFKLTDRHKDGLGRLLLEADVPAKQIAAYLGSTVRWVEAQTDYWRAVTEWVCEAGIDPCYGIGPPVDLLDAANVSASLYRSLTTILGYGSSSAESTPDRLSTSGIGGDIVTVGLRFERLIVLRVERDKSGRKVAVCRCECGAETTAKPSHLLRGEKRSCGCLRRERMAAMRNRPEVSA